MSDAQKSVICIFMGINHISEKMSINHPKIQTRWPYWRAMPLKDVDGMAGIADPDQTMPLGSV